MRKKIAVVGDKGSVLGFKSVSFHGHHTAGNPGRNAHSV